MDAQEFDTALRRVRLRANTLAGLLNVEPSTISRWRTGRQRLPVAVEILVGLVQAGVVKPGALWRFRAETPKRQRRVQPRPPLRVRQRVPVPERLPETAWLGVDDDEAS